MSIDRLRSSPLRRGINLGGLLDRSDAVAPGWQLCERHLDAVLTAGFTSVRLPVRWWGHAQDGPPHALHAGFSDLVGAVVAAALARRRAGMLTTAGLSG